MKRPPQILLPVLLILGTFRTNAQQEVGYVETFALTDNRDEALKELIPGTEDYYYYHCLHLQNQRKKDEFTALMTEWGKRFPNSGSRDILTRRQALIDYETDPKASLEYLRQQLGLNFNHQRELARQIPNLPSVLDPKLTTYEAFLARNRDDNNLSYLGLPVVEELIRTGTPLTVGQRRDALSRMERPDVQGLTELIITELKSKDNAGFGAYPIHEKLLPEQLDAISAAVPALLSNQGFVTVRLSKLAPGPEEDTENDLAARGSWLLSLWDYVKDLPPALNSLKAHILYQRLELGRLTGEYDTGLFLTYLQLPRPVAYINPEWHKAQPDSWRWQADLNADFSNLTRCQPVSGDESLVREYLLRFFVEAKDHLGYTEWVEEGFLKRLFAEAKITSGNDPEGQYTPWLSPSAYSALKDRVDIAFDPANKRIFAPGDEVTLDVWVKNVPGLTVKVFEVNTEGWFETNTAQIGTDIDLDGLVGGFEEQVAYGEPPLIRVKRSLKIPDIGNKRGVWVVELIGNGRSSRALVRKGSLQYVPRRSTAGQVFTILDEARKPIAGAFATFGGNRYDQDAKSGEILIPFTTDPGSKVVVLHDGKGFASLERMNINAESYQLEAGFHVERESVLLGGTTAVAIRPRVLLNGTPVSVKVLLEPKLTITSTSHDGIVTSLVEEDLKIIDSAELLYELKVPNRVAALSFDLRARVKNLSNGREDEVVSQGSFALNQTESTEVVADLNLGRDGTDWFVEYRGKNGEVLPDRALNVALHHRFFQSDLNVSLKTDAKGRVNLGPLVDIDRITTATAEGLARSWNPKEFGINAASRVHAAEGEVIRLPWFGGVDKLVQSDVSLLEIRSGTFVKDWMGKATLKDGYVEVAGLPAGDYSLLFRKENRGVDLAIAKGERVKNFILSGTRMLETTPVEALHVPSVTVQGDQLVIKVAGADALTRVHIAATRFAPVWRLDARLGLFSQPGLLTGTIPAAISQYVSGRDIGEEYRYILERQVAKHFPGVMLPRPGLLLNPWAVRDTDAGEQQAQEGEEYARLREMEDRSVMEQAKQDAQGQGGGVAGDADPRVMDWLAQPSAVSYNLRPDKDGLIKIALKDLGDTSWIHVMALNVNGSVARDFALPAQEIVTRDLRLPKSLDVTQKFAQRDEAAALIKAEPHVINDALSAEFETYGDLGKVYALLQTLNADATFAEFAFILQWPELPAERKRELYSKYACHELNFFLARKDPEFFAGVIKPYLVNKKDKTFMDEYLLGLDLEKYLEPWRHGRLNIVERILLGQRIDGEGANEARHIADLQERVPVDRDRDRQLLETALRGLGLRPAGDKGNLEAMKNQLGSLREESKAEALEQLGRASGVVSGGAPMAPSAQPPTALATPAPDAIAPPAPEEPEMNKRMESLEKNLDGVAAKPTSEKNGEDFGFQRKLKYVAGKDAGGELADKEVMLAGYTNADLELRAKTRALFRSLGATKEWAENNYWHLRPDQQLGGLITVNRYWNDFAAWDGKGAFVSARIVEAHRSFAEMMLALAVLDIPFPGQAIEPDAKLEGQVLTLTPKTPLLLFQQQVRPAENDPAAPNLLVSQNFYRAGDRFIELNGEKIDKFVKDEFLAGAVYGCQVVVTNPTSSIQKLDVLFQIPQGALPVAGAKPVRSFPLRLEPYRTETLDVMFYFPKAGQYTHYPVHVSKDDKIVAEAAPFAFNVVVELSKVDEASWDYISQDGTVEQVIAYLDQHNLEGLNLDRIAWRVRESGDFFQQLIGILQKRRVYSPTIFSYGIMFNEPTAIREFLLTQEGFLDGCGPWLETKLVTIDPVLRHRYEHLEYDPLVNARAHRLGAERKIMNNAFRDTYQRYLQIIAHKPTPDTIDRLAITYYLLLQDRISEALASFDKVKAADASTALQYDYCAAWLALAKEDVATARATAAKYKDYGVDKWREKFAAITAQLDEIEGKAPVVQDEEDRGQTQEALAASQPGFEVKTEGRNVTVEHRNLTGATVNYYKMNLEFLFSTNPFVGQDSARFSAIQPNKSEKIAFAKPNGEYKFELPAEFQNLNILVEVVAAGERKAQAMYASDLKVEFTENYGMVQVRKAADNSPLPKVYVKVYAEVNGEPKFFKDGYTDLRGKFDYVSLNTGDVGEVTRFSVLVLSDEHGAMVKEVKPPAR